MNNLCMDIFISSAMVELEQDREIACETINEMTFNSTMFELFPAMSESPSETYLEKVRECDIFVLLLWKKFTGAVQQEYEEAIKKNKPVLIFLKDLKNEEKRQKELVNFISRLQEGKEKASIYKEYRELKSLRKQLKEAIGTEVLRYYEFPKITQTKQELYEMGRMIIGKSYNRLYIFEKTPSLFLGCKGYTDKNEYKLAYEKKYLDALKSWIEINLKRDNTSFLYVYSNEKTVVEIENYRDNDNFIEEVKRNIEFYKNCEIESGHRFRFLPVNSYISGPLIVGDICYAMWFLGDAVSISQRNEKISNQIVSQLNRYHDVNVSYEDILNKLEIRR